MAWLFAGLAAVFLFFMSSMVGFLVQPWAPWYLAGANAIPVAGGPAPDPGDLSIHGFVSDAQRYQLARFVGWSASDAIVMVAISIAENGNGDPARLSPRNRNGTYDLGLWMVNSAWWARFGGQAALSEPLNNARAAYAIYGLQHFCAWSTYAPCPVDGHCACYLAFLARARAASEVRPPSEQA